MHKYYYWLFLLNERLVLIMPHEDGVDADVFLLCRQGIEVLSDFNLFSHDGLQRHLGICEEPLGCLLEILVV